jgi:F0F1-type ATP synthase assembly protein I
VVVVIVLVDLVLLAAGLGLGWLLDGVAESRPLLAVFGFAIGLIVAVAFTWSRVRRSPRSANR